jgi:hypothetical protein
VFIVVWTFRLKDGIDEDAFLAANERLQTEFVYQQPGFVRRTTARGKDGEWLVIGVWSSRAEAATAGEAAKGNPISHAANAMVDPSSLIVKRFETLD